MAKKYTRNQFQAQYPDDGACLQAMLQRRYGKAESCPHCGIVGKLTRIEGRRAFACKEGCHIYPCAETVFEHSPTPLTDWFYAMYLMTATRNGVSAKELQRQLDVTYKCAWRIGHQLRGLMAARNETNPPMSGHVELHETYVGARSKGGKRGRGAGKKTIVFGILERKSNVRGKVVPDVWRDTLESLVERKVFSGKIISTDELGSYRHISRLGYIHGKVSHITRAIR